MDGFAELNAVLSAPEQTQTPATQQPQAQPAAETPPVNEPTTQTPPTATPETSTPETAQTPPATEPAAAQTDENPENVFTGNRQNQAFAQMRVQNKQLLGTVSRLSQIMGLPPNLSPEQLVPIVEQRLLEIEAKASNIPVELAQRLEQAEQQRAQQEQANLRTNADLAFQKVKDTYSLTQAQLIEFAQQLNQTGKNPYQQPVDLLQEYRVLNFDRILDAERKKAAQEALARQTKAATQSTTPSKATGQPSDPSPQINSVAGLNALLGGRS